VWFIDRLSALAVRRPTSDFGPQFSSSIFDFVIPRLSALRELLFAGFAALLANSRFLASLEMAMIWAETFNRKPETGGSRAEVEGLRFEG
jgi:hypothetical protein